VSSGRGDAAKGLSEWREEVAGLPVFDTHSHLNNPGVPIGAQNVWDIVHYFWFLQELWSVGYPSDPMKLPEDKRIGHFMEAFGQVRNTAWAMVVRETIQDLYGVVLTDTRSVLRADEAIRARAVEPEWRRQVLDRMGIRRVTVNSERAADFPGLPGVGVAVPILPEYRERVERILAAKDPRSAAESEALAVKEDVAGIAARGWRGMRVGTRAFEDGPDDAIQAVVPAGNELPPGPVAERAADAFLTHATLLALEQHGMFAQFFLGIDTLPGSRVVMAVSDPRRITNLYPLFERYQCGFELVAGAPGINMDVVQPARIYPHVHAGGLWWYNFRGSTYNETLRMRVEAVPASKSVILASDARCVEWCYAKTLLVKRLLADFLHAQIRAGSINEPDALWVAREWLHDAAARRYV
jgi:glucuronate isomerase